MPVTPNISQAAKQTAKASVLTSSTRIARPEGMGATVSMFELPYLEGTKSASNHTSGSSEKWQTPLRNWTVSAATKHAKPHHA